MSLELGSEAACRRVLFEGGERGLLGQLTSLPGSFMVSVLAKTIAYKSPGCQTQRELNLRLTQSGASSDLTAVFYV